MVDGGGGIMHLNVGAAGIMHVIVDSVGIIIQLTDSAGTISLKAKYSVWVGISRV